MQHTICTVQARQSNAGHAENTDAKGNDVVVAVVPQVLQARWVRLVHQAQLVTQVQ